MAQGHPGSLDPNDRVLCRGGLKMTAYGNALEMGSGELELLQGGVAQLVEHRTHKPAVGSSILPPASFVSQGFP